MKDLTWLKEGFLKNAWIATELFGEDTPTNRANYQNKLNNVQGKRFSEEEIKKLDEIRKKIIQRLA